MHYYESSIFGLYPISLTMPVLNLSTKNSKVPILNAFPGLNTYYSPSNNLLYTPQDSQQFKFKVLITSVLWS